MEKKILKALVTKIDGEKEGLLSGVVGSNDSVDRYGEVVDQESWDLKSYKKNPVILWAHNLGFSEDRPPIGRAINVRVEKGKGLMFDIQFDMADPFASDIFRKYKEKFLNAFSVGFISHKVEKSDDRSEPPILKDNELLELSAVPVPANPEALQSLQARSFAIKSWKSLLETAEAEDDKHVKKATKDLKPTPEEAPEPKIVPVPKDEEGETALHADKPTKTSLGADPRSIAIVREATRQLQAVLAEYNRLKKA